MASGQMVDGWVADWMDDDGWMDCGWIVRWTDADGQMGWMIRWMDVDGSMRCTTKDGRMDGGQMVIDRWTVDGLSDGWTKVDGRQTDVDGGWMDGGGTAGAGCPGGKGRHHLMALIPHRSVLWLRFKKSLLLELL
jgi:hypothetical protein